MVIRIDRIGIIGGGAIGRAVGGELAKAGHQVIYYDKNPELSTAADLNSVLHSCSMILLCVPSWAVRSLAEAIAQDILPGRSHLIVALAKGVDPGFVTMDQVLRESLPPTCDIGVMYGPMLASEISHGQPSYAVFGLSNTKWFKVVSGLFEGTSIGIESSGDTRSVALCAVLKNVYALGLGVCDGLGLGMNVKGKLVTLALQEMKHLLAELRANPTTVEGLAGLGDLVTTGFSEESFNYRTGRSLGEGAGEELTSEGLTALKELALCVNLKHYPVADIIYRIAYQNTAPAAMTKLLS